MPPLTLLAAAGIIALVVQLRDRGQAQDQQPAAEPERPRLIGYQAADDPPVTPPSGGFDRRCILLDAWQRAALPVVAACVPPTGSGSLTADVGETVMAVADGLVVLTASPAELEGAMLTLAHRDPEGREFHSVYSGLAGVTVARGMLVARGSKLGVAARNGAHAQLCAVDEAWPEAVRNDNPQPPVPWLSMAEADALAPSPLSLALRPEDDPWSRLSAEGPEAAERLLEILGQQETEEKAAD